jgi:hypothetical protein
MTYVENHFAFLPDYTVFPSCFESAPTVVETEHLRGGKNLSACYFPVF